MLYHWATETTVSEVYYEVLMKQVLYTWEMVNFELVKDIKKDVFHLIASVGQRKILRPHQDLIPHRDSEFFFCPMLTTRQKTSFFILCPKFVFIVFILLSSLFYGGNSLHVPKMVEKKYTQKVVIGFGVFACAVFILF